jgi:hypothetical protein
MRNSAISHAAALALVGWYLMIPPTQKDLDDSCGAHSPSGLTLAPVNTLPETATTTDYASWLLAKASGDQETRLETFSKRRCDTEATEIQPDASLSHWLQLSAFESLSQCQAGLSSLAAHRAALSTKEQRKTMAEAMTSVWGKQASQMADATLKARTDQELSATCIATDDPRLTD